MIQKILLFTLFVLASCKLDDLPLQKFSDSSFISTLPTTGSSQSGGGDTVFEGEDTISFITTDTNEGSRCDLYNISDDQAGTVEDPKVATNPGDHGYMRSVGVKAIINAQGEEDLEFTEDRCGPQGDIQLPQHQIRANLGFSRIQVREAILNGAGSVNYEPAVIAMTSLTTYINFVFLMGYNPEEYEVRVIANCTGWSNDNINYTIYSLRNSDGEMEYRIQLFPYEGRIGLLTSLRLESLSPLYLRVWPMRFVAENGQLVIVRRDRTLEIGREVDGAIIDSDEVSLCYVDNGHNTSDY
jgi:hypothetical protein